MAYRIHRRSVRSRVDGLERVNELGRAVYEELIALPERISTAPKKYDPELRSNLESIRLQDDFYLVIGGEHGEGAVIVSQLPDPVEFFPLLGGRTVNIVPVESLQEVLGRFDNFTQTVGVFPDSVKRELVDLAPLYGVQRLVSLGYCLNHSWCTPHDGMELERRMCRWVVNQTSPEFPLAYAHDRRASDDDFIVSATLRAVRAG